MERISFPIYSTQNQHDHTAEDQQAGHEGRPADGHIGGDQLSDYGHERGHKTDHGKNHTEEEGYAEREDRIIKIGKPEPHELSQRVVRCSDFALVMFDHNISYVGCRAVEEAVDVRIEILVEDDLIADSPGDDPEIAGNDFLRPSQQNAG